jgi:hypothetical protein
MFNIWCYWEQGIDNLPLFVKLCIKSWKKNIGTDFKINIITKQTFLEMQHEYNDIFFNLLTSQQQSDIVRLHLLYNFGGIWIDISTILVSDLSWVIDKFNMGFKQVGFYIDFSFYKKTKFILESWFIAIKEPKNYIIFCWKNAFTRILQESIKNGGIKHSQLWKNTNKENINIFEREYLAIHVANLWCIQNNTKYREQYINTIYLYNARTTALLLEWNQIFKGYGYNKNFPIIKFGNRDRKFLKYWCSHRLRNILKNETNDYYALNPDFVNIIILFIIICLIKLFYLIKK